MAIATPPPSTPQVREVQIKSGPSFRRTTDNLTPWFRKNWLFGRTLAICLEEDSIQTAVALHTGQKHRLISSDKSYIPSSASQGPNRINFLCESIDRFVQAEGRGLYRLVLIMPGLETAYREINLPALSGSDLQEAIRFEALKALPFPDSDVHFGYRILGRTTRDGRPRYRIGITGCLKRSIETVLEPFDRLKLNPAAIWSTQDTLTSILPSMSHFKSSDTYALLNVERQRSEISFYIGGELQFSHHITLGSAFLSNRADLTMYEYFAEALAGEIQNSIDYYTGSHTFSNASEIYVYGNLAFSEEIIDLMGERLGFTFRRFPIESVSISSSLNTEQKTSLTISLPVAAGAVTSAHPANLLPTDRLVRFQRRSIDQRGIATLIGIALACAFMTVSQIAGIGRAQENLVSMQSQAESLKASPLFETFDVVQRSIQTEKVWIDRFGQKQAGSTDFLRALSQITPPAIRFYLLQENLQTDQSMNGQFETYISAIATELNVTPELVIHDFIMQLGHLPGLTAATVTRYQKRRNLNGVSEIDFQIQVRGTR